MASSAANACYADRLRRRAESRPHRRRQCSRLLQPPAASACRCVTSSPFQLIPVVPQGKLEQEQRAALIERGKGIKEQLEGLEWRLEQLEMELQREGQRLPNMTHPGALRCGLN